MKLFCGSENVVSTELKSRGKVDLWWHCGAVTLSSFASYSEMQPYDSRHIWLSELFHFWLFCCYQWLLPWRIHKSICKRKRGEATTQQDRSSDGKRKRAENLHKLHFILLIISMGRSRSQSRSPSRHRHKSKRRKKRSRTRSRSKDRSGTSSRTSKQRSRSRSRDRARENRRRSKAERYAVFLGGGVAL